ncbi:hypothetical protein MLD38_035549 [Melastoma candidum]|uniref:Uncharacterized protein n=3 Tax=Melastoma candidum TaxID=119954 RepID=A0ACB9L0V2_9MYRT|nr:hypothetical protein MLD38_038778 [Melastoma candidum]KAI4303110.1 hypothetical protein MLD38_038779 [Melastoma candidum]KAI4310580.1 hypothetical protein MLD38_035549 [Melastoma candidum]
MIGRNGDIGWVGISNGAVMHTHARASSKGKRVQSNMWAKNHAIVLPDASIDATLIALVAVGFGAAGQRCMALVSLSSLAGQNLGKIN